MTHLPKQFFIVDPRTFEGDPFEVAERAAEQAAGLVRLADQATEAAELMARNAEMERDLILSGDCDAATWPTTPQGKHWTGVRESLGACAVRLKLLTKAAAFNPKDGRGGRPAKS